MKASYGSKKEESKIGHEIPAVCLEKAGIMETRCAEIHTKENLIAVIKGKMTAFELCDTISALCGLASILTSHLAQVCGYCDGCDACGEVLENEQNIKIPHDLLDELGIPRNAKLDAYADPDEGLILVGPADYEHDISDISDGLIKTLVAVGACISELDEHLMSGEIVYGE